MSRTIRRPARVWAYMPPTCAAVVACLAAACSDPCWTPVYHQPSTAAATARTFVVAPEGRIEAPGTSAAPLALGRAVAMAPTGSTIRLAAGTYQTAGLTIDRSITLRSRAWRHGAARGQHDDRGRSVGAGGACLAHTMDRHGPRAGGYSVDARHLARAAMPQQRFLIEGKGLAAASSVASVGVNSFYVDTTDKWLYVGQDPALHPVQTGLRRHRHARKSAEREPHWHQRPRIRGHWTTRRESTRHDQRRHLLVQRSHWARRQRGELPHCPEREDDLQRPGRGRGQPLEQHHHPGQRHQQQQHRQLQRVAGSRRVERHEHQQFHGARKLGGGQRLERDLVRRELDRRRRGGQSGATRTSATRSTSS